MTKEEFNDWVDIMYHKCIENTDRYVYFFQQPETLVIDWEIREVGISRCHPDDEFDCKTGIAIAYARCGGYKIPKIKEDYFTNKPIVRKVADNLNNEKLNMEDINMNYVKFNDWVDQMNLECDNNIQNDSTNRYRCFFRGNKTYIVDLSKGKMGVSKCHEDDKFNTKIGRAIAWARLKDYEIPNIAYNERWRADYGTLYYLVSTRCTGVSNIEYNDNTDSTLYDIGNYFESEKRAEEVAEKFRTLLKLEKLHDIFCSDYKPNWNNTTDSKWYVAFDYKEHKYCIGSTISIDYSKVYFPEVEIARKVADILNKELIDDIS